jgi:hypothetical protein
VSSLEEFSSIQKEERQLIFLYLLEEWSFYKENPSLRFKE